MYKFVGKLNKTYELDINSYIKHNMNSCHDPNTGQFCSGESSGLSTEDSKNIRGSFTPLKLRNKSMDIKSTEKLDSDIVNMLTTQYGKHVPDEIETGNYDKVAQSAMDLLYSPLKSPEAKVIPETQPILPIEHSFDFESTADPRKGFPYVATMKISDGKLNREFHNMDRTYGKKEVTVSGKFTAKDGDVIEQQTGGSWNNKYRYYSLVDEGKLKELGSHQSSELKMDITKYLKGIIDKDELKSSYNIK